MPVDIRMTASPTKNGPAAPVTLSPNLSRALKQRKTEREHQVMMVGQTNEISAQSYIHVDFVIQFQFRSGPKRGDHTADAFLTNFQAVPRALFPFTSRDCSNYNAEYYHRGQGQSGDRVSLNESRSNLPTGLTSIMYRSKNQDDLHQARINRKASFSQLKTTKMCWFLENEGNHRP